MPPAYELRIVPRVHDVAQATWDALVEDDASPFVLWEWLACMEDAGCVGPGTGWTAAHLTLYREGTLVAAAPAYVKENSEGEFVFDWNWADVAQRAGAEYYPKVIVAVPFTPATGDRVLVAKGEDRDELTRVLGAAVRQWLDATGLSSAHVLFPTEKEAERWAKADYATRLGVQYHWHRGADVTWDDFLARFNSKRRNALKREAAQPAKDGVTIETIDPSTITPGLVREMFALYCTTVDKFFYGRRYLNLRFFELVAERFRPYLAWVVARQEGRIIASAFNVQRGRVLYGRYWGTHVDLPFLHFNVCYYEGVRYCLARGLDVFEPGAGGEHKRVRGFDPTVTYSSHWIQHRKLRFAINDFVKREAMAIRGHLAHGDDEGLGG